jgi:hypothetical protein
MPRGTGKHSHDSWLRRTVCSAAIQAGASGVVGLLVWLISTKGAAW